MLSKDILVRIRRLRLLARRVVAGDLGGDYASRFRGSGMRFEEVRAYAPGDDVRAIDWNVTARHDSAAFVKRFVEERERTIILALDATASMDFSTGFLSKRDVAAELAAVLAFAAVSHDDRVGLAAFGGEDEMNLPAAKGDAHVVRLITRALTYRAGGRHLGADVALDRLVRAVPRRAVLFLIGDFLGGDVSGPLRRAASRCEVIGLRVVDPLERSLPDAGVVLWRDAETGQRRTLDTSDPAARAAYEAAAAERSERLRKAFAAAKADYAEVTTAGGHVEELVRFFRRRRAAGGDA